MDHTETFTIQWHTIGLRWSSASFDDRYCMMRRGTLTTQRRRCSYLDFCKNAKGMLLHMYYTDLLYCSTLISLYRRPRNLRFHPPFHHRSFPRSPSKHFIQNYLPDELQVHSDYQCRAGSFHPDPNLHGIRRLVHHANAKLVDSNPG